MSDTTATDVSLATAALDHVGAPVLAGAVDAQTERVAKLVQQVCAAQGDPVSLPVAQAAVWAARQQHLAVAVRPVRRSRRTPPRLLLLRLTVVLLVAPVLAVACARLGQQMGDQVWRTAMQNAAVTTSTWGLTEGLQAVQESMAP